MASSDTCPESEKKKLYNVFSNVTADMLESHYGITVPDNIKNYRVVIQDFTPQLAIIGADNITKGSTFIFYDPDPDNKKDQDGYIKFYDREGKPIDSINIKKIEDMVDCKKLKIVEEKLYEEKAYPAKYSKDGLEKATESCADKFILHKEGKAHHIKGYKSINCVGYNKYKTAVTEFIGITLFNAALKKAGLYECTTEYTLVKDDDGKVYFDSTDARDDKSWEYIEPRKIIRDDLRIIQDIEHSKGIDFNLLTSTVIAGALGASDLSIGHIKESMDTLELNNILQFIDDKNIYHTKYIDLSFIMTYMSCNCFMDFNNQLIKSWYCGYIGNANKFNYIACRDAIFNAFRAVTELDVIGELEAIKPILGVAGDSYDIAEMSKTITDHISSFCDQLKLLPDIFVDPLYKKEWQEFCEKTDFNTEVVKLAEELKHKYSAKQSTSLAAATESETMDTTDTYKSNEQGSQQI